ncbi:MAG: hypothetical protein M1814_003313 [Vezdaea aestivalis]|nr:MAG: hypothetical protein M1814_003313 [Vezdaea aestivalis]
MADKKLFEKERTRIVCISDTHNHTPVVPAGDILIHAGDLTNNGSLSELQKAVKWLERLDFEAKVVIAGNHDVSLDPPFLQQYGSYFHNTNPQSSAESIALLNQSSVTYLNDSLVTIRLSSKTGPKTQCTIFGSPYSPSRDVWAFGYSPSEAEAQWAKIPLSSDIVVTHTPAKYHLDECHGEALGCPALSNALWRVRPRLHVCGHVHTGRGAERVKWDLADPNVRFKEESKSVWTDVTEGTKKIAKIDLTGKDHQPALENDGSNGLESEDVGVSGPHSGSYSIITKGMFPDEQEFGMEKETDSYPSYSTAQGKGGNPKSNRSDRKALDGRSGRMETCFVNAAIMAEGWAKARAKGEGKPNRRTNKPIVVDLYLPVWTSQSDTSGKAKEGTLYS